MVRTNEEAEALVRRLERQEVERMVAALRKIECEEAEIARFQYAVENADNLTEDEIGCLFFDYGGKLAGECIYNIKALRELTRPIAARGWRRRARWLLTLFLAMIGFYTLGNDPSSSLEALFGMALGVGCATIINWYFLGGRPELRHAINHLQSPEMQEAYRTIGQKTPLPKCIETLTALEAGT